MKYIYYLTNDINQIKDKSEIKFLEKKFKKIIVLTNQRNLSKVYKSKNIKYLKYKNKFKSQVNLIRIWGKFIYLISRIANTKTEIYFPKRERFYNNSNISKKLIDYLWNLKLSVNSFIPYYSDIYYLPIIIYRELIYFIKPFKKNKGTKKSRNRILIQDSVLYNTYLNYGIKKGPDFIESKTLAFVRSWDNPFYTYFDRNADEYIVWSKSMELDIKKVQDFKPKIKCYSGAIFLNNFKEEIKLMQNNKNISNKNFQDIKFIGYAATFCEPILIDAEIDLILEFNKILKKNNLRKKILFRPYPSVPKGRYKRLLKKENIIYFEGSGLYSDNKEKYDFCTQCDYFISLGTSFTFESLISKTRVLQLYINKEDRFKKYQKLIFARFDQSDHLQDTFKKYLHNIFSEEEIINFDSENDYFKESSNYELFKKIGIEIE